MEIWKFFVIALMPNLKVLLITAAGAFFAINRFDILNETVTKNINIMVYFVFSPALVCSGLAKSITLRSMVKLWFMPLNILLTVIIGTSLGWLLIKITRAPRHLRGLVLGCCAVGNLGNLPLIIVPAMCKEKGNLFGDVNVCSRNGLAYASLSMALGSILVWSYAFNIVRIYSTPIIISKVVKVDDKFTENPTSTAETDPENLSKCSKQTLDTTEDKSETSNCVNQLEIETIGIHRQEKKGKLMKCLNIITIRNLKLLLPPTLFGAVFGLLFGVVPQFRNLLVGGRAPLHVILDSLSIIGDACIPSMTMLIGANLLEGLKKQNVQIPIIIGIMIVRNIALPAIGVGIVKGAAYLGLIHEDPLYQFLLLLQFAVPPAVAISTSAQLFESGKGECSVIMLATYSCAAVSLTLWCTFFIWLVL